MPYRILLRRDLAANWIYNNPVLMLGEPGFESDTGKLKIGDGQSDWVSLSYVEGVEGQTGPIGPSGPVGPSGSSGTSGIDGVGIPVTVGATGSTGSFTQPVPDDTGKSAYGWIKLTISGVDYYVPAWT